MSVQRLPKLSQIAKAHGFTLIEVMVTVFILSVGILGVAGMQAVSVRESGNTYHRTQADLLVGDIVDRMRANRNESRLGAASGYLADPATAAATDCSSDICDEATLATYDLYQWRQAIQRSNLPAGMSNVLFVQDISDASGAVIVGSVFTVQVFWDENRDGDRGQGCDPSDTADMSCTSLTIQI
jgi:type IV pilus assembly protein PilV